jgi:hypothetical protein
MLTKRTCYDGDKDDLLQERIKAQREAEGPPVPWIPPTQEQLDAQFQPKPRKTRRSRSMWAVNSRVPQA